MPISTIEELREHISCESHLLRRTVNNAIELLGFPLTGSGEIFNKLSNLLKDYAQHQPCIGSNSFISSNEAVAFFKANRKDIDFYTDREETLNHTDIFNYVWRFNVFNKSKPSLKGIESALWGHQFSNKLNYVYEGFTRFVLEKISRTWNFHLFVSIHILDLTA